MNDDDLKASFAAHTEGATHFTRRMAINIADWFGVKPRHVIDRLEALSLLPSGSWDWFCDNGGITKEHVKQARADRNNCAQRVFGGCDPATCDRQCSSTITAHEAPSLVFGKRDLAGPIFIVAVIAIVTFGFFAAANAGLSRAEHDYQITRRV